MPYSFSFFWQYRARQQVLNKAHADVVKSQQQTELALSSNKSGVWEANLSQQTLLNNRFVTELGYHKSNESLALIEFLDFIHPADRSAYLNHWNAFAKQSNQEQWNITYRLNHQNGKWLWYQDIGRVVEVDEANKPIKVTGIYTNITEQRANALQASVLGEAFSQINDWLLILDSQLKPFSANTSFSDTFAITGNITDLTIKDFVRTIGRAQFLRYINVLKTLKPKQNWKTEAYIHTQKNPSHPVHISVTAVAKDNQAISHYVIVISDLTEQKRAEDELRYLANYDPLTGLPNRSLMHSKINK